MRQFALREWLPDVTLAPLFDHYLSKEELVIRSAKPLPYRLFGLRIAYENGYPRKELETEWVRASIV